jgi:hypothetical protein
MADYQMGLLSAIAELPSQGGPTVAGEEERSKAQEAHAKAIQRVPLARQWGLLNTESNTLNQVIQSADARARNAEGIRTDHARLHDLTQAVPVLRQLVKLRGGIVAAGGTLAGRQAEAKRLGDAIRAKELRDEIARDDKFVAAADATKKLKEKLDGFDRKLADQLEAARRALQSANDAVTATLEGKAAAAGLLRDCAKINWSI